MKKTLMLVLAMMFVLPLAASAKKRSKKGKKEVKAAPTAPGEVKRKMCGFELGGVITDPEQQHLGDVTEVYKRMLPEGDKMFSVREGLETGASGCLLQVYGDKVWRIQATYPPTFTKTSSWEKTTAASTAEFGEPEKTEQSNEKTDRLKLVWKDGKTRLAATREVRGKDSGVDAERGQIYYLYAIEDIALSMRAVKAKGERP
jgi:hypothetical protein